LQRIVIQVLQPQQAAAQFRAGAQARHDARNGPAVGVRQLFPAFASDDHEVDLDARGPQLLERLERLQVALARFDRTDHQKARPGQLLTAPETQIRRSASAATHSSQAA
jgi:hypothetical protein